MANPVNWFHIEGGDGVGLAQFYGSVFGWKLMPSPDGSPMKMVKQEKGGIAGGIAPGRNGEKMVTVYVGVDNIDRALDAIGVAGGQTIMPKMALPAGWGSIAMFSDPEGNPIGLWQTDKKPSAPRKAVRKAANAVKRAAKKAVARVKSKLGGAKGKAKPKAKTAAKTKARPAAKKKGAPKRR